MFDGVFSVVGVVFSDFGWGRFYVFGFWCCWFGCGFVAVGFAHVDLVGLLLWLAGLEFLVSGFVGFGGICCFGVPGYVIWCWWLLL